MSGDCSQLTTVGSYLVDTLDPAEREAFVQHLHHCQRCRTEVEELRPVVRMLDVLRRDRSRHAGTPDNQR